MTEEEEQVLTRRHEEYMKLGLEAHYSRVQIVVEGMDGTGKSTLSKLVAEQLPWKKPPFHTCFPSKDGPVGQLIRRGFSGEVKFGKRDFFGSEGRVYGHLMIADGIDRAPVLDAHLETGTSVVLDRHPAVSGWAYQTEHMTLRELHAMQGFSDSLAIRGGSTVTFILDVPAGVAVERMRQRGEIRNPIFEQDGVAYVERLRQRYLAYPAMHDHACVRVLDATRPLDELLAQVKTAVDGERYTVFA